MTKLTANETTILKAAAATSFNYDTAADEKADNATIFTVEDVATATERTIASVRGVVGSLFKKGLLCETEEPNTGNTAISFTDDGIDAFYALIDAVAAGGSDNVPTPAKQKKPTTSAGLSRTDTSKGAAKKGRALYHREPGTVLVPVKEGTKRAAIVKALLKGARLEDIAAIHGCDANDPRVRSDCTTLLSRFGIGCFETRDAKGASHFKAILPEGSKAADVIKG